MANTSYQIKKGDTLSGIASANGTTVADLIKLNPIITNPNLIQAGASLNLAGQATTPSPSLPATAPTSPAKDAYIKSLTVKRTKDNADGTSTNYLSDGSRDTGIYRKNTDGSLTFVPQEQMTDVENSKISYNAAKQSYLDSLKEAPAVSKARQAYLNYQTGLNKGLQNIQDQAIPLQFITGQQESLKRNAAIDGQTLQSNYETEVDRQANNQKLAQTQYSFAAEDYNNLAKAEAERLKPIEIGGNLIQQQPDGSYQTIYQGQQKLDTSVTEAGGRRLLINNQTGQTIADLGDASSPINYGGLLSASDATALGVPYGTTIGQAAGLGITPTKPLTEDQAKSVGFYNRTQASSGIIDSISDQISKQMTGWMTFQSLLPNATRNPLYQTYDQASRDFINAILRRESGAAIAESEFSNAKAQYLPQPGDNPATLEQKARNRATSIDALRVSTGSYGASGSSSSQQANANASAAQKILSGGGSPGDIVNRALQPSSPFSSQVRQMQQIGANPQAITDWLKQQSQSFNRGGANLPQANANPGNVKAGGIADKYAIGVDKQGHLIFPNEQAGFQALSDDLKAKITGNSRYVGANPTIAQLGKVYAEDKNWPYKVAAYAGVNVNTPTASIPFNTLLAAVAKQEGYYA